MKSARASMPCPCASHNSKTAGTDAQYVPKNGTAPNNAASTENPIIIEKFWISSINYQKANK